MSKLIWAFGLALLGALAIAVAPVAADEPQVTCQGTPATIVADGSGPVDGTSGPDVIVGKATGNDFAAGMLGNDTVTGGNGNDELFGGPGNDQMSGDNGDDVVVGNFGNDSLSGGNGADFLDGDNTDENNGPALDPNANTDTCSRRAAGRPRSSSARFSPKSEPQVARRRRASAGRPSAARHPGVRHLVSSSARCDETVPEVNSFGGQIVTLSRRFSLDENRCRTPGVKRDVRQKRHGNVTKARLALAA